MQETVNQTSTGERAAEKPPKAPKLTSIKKKKLNEAMFVYCAIAVPVLQFLIFYVAVNINSILLAFKKYDMDTGKYVYQGFQNFKDFLFDLKGEALLNICFGNSIKLYLVNLLIGLPLGVCVSFFVYRKIPFSGFFKVVLFLPSIISSVVMTLMFKYFMELVIPPLLVKMGMTATQPNFFYDSNYAFNTLLLFGLWTGFGGGIIVQTGAMSRIPESLIEYGQLEGMNMRQEFFTVTIPLTYPTLSISLITGIAAIFTGSASAYTFYGDTAPADVYTLGFFMFTKVIGSNASLSQYPYASAAGLCFTIIAAPITLLVKYLLERFGPETEY